MHDCRWVEPEQNMPNDISPEHQKRITEATEDLAVAQTEVERALREVTTGSRADKTIISEVLKIAFERLTAARSKLEGVLSGR